MSNTINATHLKNMDLSGRHVKRAPSQDSVQKPQDKKLWEMSLKFEALLLQQMMSSMRKSVPESGLLNTGFASDTYNAMFDQVIAEAGSHHSGLGIADGIYRQLNQLHKVQEQPAGTDTLNIREYTQGRNYGRY